MKQTPGHLESALLSLKKWVFVKKKITGEASIFYLGLTLILKLNHADKTVNLKVRSIQEVNKEQKSAFQRG